MLSLRRPTLCVLSCADFVEAIQDPRHLFEVERPESQVAEVIIHVSAHLTTRLPLVQLGSYEAQHCFVNKCKNKKTLGPRSVSLDTGEKNEHNCEESISKR